MSSICRHILIYPALTLYPGAISISVLHVGKNMSLRNSCRKTYYTRIWNGAARLVICGDILGPEFFPKWFINCFTRNLRTIPNPHSLTSEGLVPTDIYLFSYPTLSFLHHLSIIVIASYWLTQQFASSSLSFHVCPCSPLHPHYGQFEVANLVFFFMRPSHRSLCTAL